MAQAATADQTAPPSDERSRRIVHGDLPRLTLIFRPTADERMIHGRSGGYFDALQVLRYALEEPTLMAGLRRALNWGRAQLMSDIELIERLAREVACGRMILCSRPEPQKPKDDRYAAAHDKPYRALLAGRFEGSVDYMYLDSRGYVTVGVGKMLPTPSSAELVAFVHRATRKPATSTEKVAAYTKVRTSIANRTAAAYLSLTDLDLAPGESDRLLDRELEKAEDGCRTLFGGWDTFPMAAQLALLDMVYNMGAGHELTRAQRQAGMREHGLFQFHRLRASVAKADWAAASRECERQGIQKSRNSWTRDKFLEAAHIAPPRPEPHRALKL
jgi:GH24 family phage-related lysozyme (muramidase)